MTWITDCREFRRKMLVGLRWQHAGRRRQDENFTSDEGGRNGEEERYQEDEEEREREIDPRTLQKLYSASGGTGIESKSLGRHLACRGSQC